MRLAGLVLIYTRTADGRIAVQFPDGHVSIAWADRWLAAMQAAPGVH